MAFRWSTPRCCSAGFSLISPAFSVATGCWTGRLPGPHWHSLLITAHSQRDAMWLHRLPLLPSESQPGLSQLFLGRKGEAFLLTFSVLHFLFRVFLHVTSYLSHFLSHWNFQSPFSLTQVQTNISEYSLKQQKCPWAVNKTLPKHTVKTTKGNHERKYG